MNDKHEIEIPVTETERQKFEVLRRVMGADDYSELTSEILKQQFGDIHPDALVNEDIDLDALMAGELDPADVPSEYKIDNYDADETEVSDDAE